MKWYENRTIMTPIITALIEFVFLVLINIFQIELPFTQDQLVTFVTGAFFFVVGIISGGNVVHDVVNSAAGNIWDSEAEQYVSSNQNGLNS